MTPKTTHMEERPPIVAVLGHVDHGKSTLLDYIRKEKTVEKEAGGITQHIAAYEVEWKREGVVKRITFIDTPGHAAFQAIRARGASVADIAILVVAADDGVRAQTLEALQSIRAAGIPFVVAINKIDKPNASVERAQHSLMEHGIYLEKFGGDVPWTAISAKTGAGVDELLDLLLLVAELQEYKADKNAPAEGYVIEAHRDPKRGIAATLIITNGVLKSGSYVVAGHAVAPVRLMESQRGTVLKEASFSTPVLLIGFDELPAVGASFRVRATKRAAEEARTLPSPTRPPIATSEEDGRFIMPLIVKADTTGSLEAIQHELRRVGDAHTGVRMVLSGIGAVNEDDIKAAIASSGTPAFVIGFNTEVDAIARERARQFGVRVETFNIIYKLTERVADVLEETRPKRKVEVVLGRARVLKMFSRRKSVHLIGGSVFEGVFERNASVRIMRKGEEQGVGFILNIQTNKQNTARVEKGSEFGAEIEAECDIVENDMLECFKTATE